MPDYGSWPIWRHDGEIGNLDPRKLGVTEELACALEDWAATYDSHLNVSDPAATTWTEEEKKEFDIVGRSLCQRLSEEVGARFRVFYSARCIPVEELTTRNGGLTSGQSATPGKCPVSNHCPPPGVAHP
ncbi:MAG: hypothetical protein IPL39_08420 [Opitutaceae bacterium]|nr:hypothetical protein [Opitutaceae bacterium]